MNDDPYGYEAEPPVDLSRSAWSIAPPTPSRSLTEPVYPVPRAQPATWGWRGRMHRLTGGLVQPVPGPEEQRYRRAEEAIRRDSGRRLIMVANVKGGSHKTTTALMLGSIFGHLRGGGVVVWDNHETRGTVGHRAEAGEAGATVRQLLSRWDRVSHPGQLRTRELIDCVRRQPSNYDVLASDDSADVAPIGGMECGWLGALLRLHYGLIIMDTGDNLRAGNWQWGAHTADQLVIPVPLEPEGARAAVWMCDHLERSGMGALVRRAVVITTPVNSGDGRRIADFFSARTAAVVPVPFDPRLAGGATIGYSLTSEDSRRAWTVAAATVASHLAALPVPPPQPAQRRHSGGVVLPFPANQLRRATS